MADANFGEIGSGIGGVAGGIGDLFAAGGYGDAAAAAEKDAELTRRMTAIQEVQEQRKDYMLMGGTESDVAGAGFAMSGSGLDILRSSAQQASLSKDLIATQGEINATTFDAQAAAYNAQANASTAGGVGGIISGALDIGVGLALL